MAKTPKIAALEGLRGYMAWAVVFAHTSQLTGIERMLPAKVTAIVNGGEPAVNVFIMLSGFVITHLCLSDPEPYWRYIKRRARRIYPIYLLCLALGTATLPALLTAHTAPWSIDPEMWQVRSAAEQERFFTHLALHLSLLHGLVPDNVLAYSSRTLLGPAWSLSLEWQFYLIAPAVVACLRKSRLSLLATCAALIALWIASHRGIFGVWAYPSMVLLAMPLFLVGMLTRLFWSRLQKSPVLLVLSGGAVAGFFAGSHKHEFWVWTLFIAAALQEPNPKRNRVLAMLTANRIATKLGSASYSTYLVHIPLMVSAVSLAIKFGGPHMQRNVIAAAAMTLILLVPVSLILYTHVEKRFMAKARKPGAPSEPPLVAQVR
ncbi:exopolysaccharide production protein ExoZ [Burkholderia multivorans]